MDKILVIEKEQEVCTQIEEILYEIVNAGVELFFASTKEKALEILEKEKPQLIFIDASLIGDDEKLWTSYKGHIVLMRTKEQATQVSEDYLVKPLRAEEMIAKCYKLLGLRQKSGPPRAL